MGFGSTSRLGRPCTPKTRVPAGLAIRLPPVVTVIAKEEEEWEEDEGEERKKHAFRTAAQNSRGQDDGSIYD